MKELRVQAGEIEKGDELLICLGRVGCVFFFISPFF